MKLFSIPFNSNYSITKTGKVWSNLRNRWLKPMINNRGYEMVTLMPDKINPRLTKNKTNWWLVHRLVAIPFITNPNNYPCVLHKFESIPHNNRATNLWWGTKKQNSDDMAIKLRAKNNNTILTDPDVKYIRQFSNTPTNKQILAAKFGVAITTIHDVLTRRHFKYIH